ncbi:MAG: excisionase family DNA-binding protein [Bacillota bacterium]
MFKTIEEFSKITGLGRDYVRQLCKADGFPALRVGRKYMINVDNALEYLSKQAVYKDYLRKTKTPDGKSARKAVN